MCNKKICQPFFLFLQGRKEKDGLLCQNFYLNLRLTSPSPFLSLYVDVEFAIV